MMGDDSPELLARGTIRLQRITLHTYTIWLVRLSCVAIYVFALFTLALGHSARLLAGSKVCYQTFNIVTS